MTYKQILLNLTFIVVIFFGHPFLADVFSIGDLTDNKVSADHATCTLSAPSIINLEYGQEQIFDITRRIYGEPDYQVYNQVLYHENYWTVSQYLTTGIGRGTTGGWSNRIVGGGPFTGLARANKASGTYYLRLFWKGDLENHPGPQCRRTVTVNIGDPTPPTADLTIEGQTQITASEGTILPLDWLSESVQTYSHACETSNNWNNPGTRPVTGTEMSSSITSSNSSFSITCSNQGGSADATVSATVIAPPTKDVLDLTVNGTDGPVSVDTASDVNLSWSSQGLTDCRKYGDWTGSASTSGSEAVTATNDTNFYYMTCKNSEGHYLTDIVEVYLNNQTYSLNITANGEAPVVNINSGNQVILAWSGQNITNCVASGSWSGSKSHPGSLITSAITEDQQYTLTCTKVDPNNPSSTEIIKDSVTVKVVAAQPSATLTIVDTSSSVTSDTGTVPTVTAVAGSELPISWSSENATTCSTSNNWINPGNRNTSGNEFTPALNSNQSFAITCTGSNGNLAQAQINVEVVDPPIPPLVDLKINNSDGPLSVLNADTLFAQWKVDSVNSCTAYNNNATSNWTGSKATTGGEENIGTANGSNTYHLVCLDTNGAYNTDKVVVNSAATCEPYNVADFNQDCVVNLDDFNILKNNYFYFTDNPTNGNTDSNPLVNAIDLITLSLNYLLSSL